MYIYWKLKYFLDILLFSNGLKEFKRGVHLSFLLTAMTSAANAISNISTSAVVSLPLIRIRIGNDNAWTAGGMNKESISVKP